MKNATRRARLCRLNTAIGSATWSSRSARNTSSAAATCRIRSFRMRSRRRCRWLRRSLGCHLLSRHDDFRDAVFGEKLAMAAPAGKEALDAAVGKCALDGKLLGELHLNVVAGGDVIAAADGLFALHPGMEEGEHLAAGIHGVRQVGNQGRDQPLR